MSPAGRRRIVIAGGTGPLGQALARQLEPTCDVRCVGTTAQGAARANLLSVAEAEVSLAGADVVVFLARTSRPRARLVQAQSADVDVLLADSVARALERVKPSRLVSFFATDTDERAAVLARAKCPTSRLIGGGDDPGARLAALVQSTGDVETVQLPVWSGAHVPEDRWSGASTVLSVQRLAAKPGSTAAQHARAYFEWLPSAAPGTSTVIGAEGFEVRSGGVSLIRLRRATGQGADDLEVLEVRDGALVAAHAGATFEFRLIAGQLFTALRDFVPAMPWLAYRASQAPMHARTMRRFGEHLARA